MWLVVWPVASHPGRPGPWAEDAHADLVALEGVARGDPDALAELYDRNARPVFSLALRILRDRLDAEDVVQEVFAQAWRQAGHYDAKRGVVAAWLLTLTRSRAIDRLRARRSRDDRALRGRDTMDLRSNDLAPDVQFLTAERNARVRGALDELPLLQRMALELAYYEGLTHAEIAERLEQPLGTVKTRIRLALLKLREALAGTS